jgi:hypothetical protein
MRFLKENSYDIIRLYINQIGITIFSLVLYFSVGTLENEALALKLKVAISIFAMLFYFVLLYTAAWDWGAKDKIRVDAGKQNKTTFKGALMALIANIPNYVLAIGSLISAFFLYNGSKAAVDVYAIFNLILRLFTAMYLGLIQGVFNSFANEVNLYYLLQAIGYCILPLLAVLATHIGYVFGLKEIKLIKNSGKTHKKG